MSIKAEWWTLLLHTIDLLTHKRSFYRLGCWIVSIFRVQSRSELHTRSCRSRWTNAPRLKDQTQSDESENPVQSRKIAWLRVLWPRRGEWWLDLSASRSACLRRSRSLNSSWSSLIPAKCKAAHPLGRPPLRSPQDDGLAATIPRWSVKTCPASRRHGLHREVPLLSLESCSARHRPRRTLLAKCVRTIGRFAEELANRNCRLRCRSRWRRFSW